MKKLFLFSMFLMLLAGCKQTTANDDAAPDYTTVEAVASVDTVAAMDYTRTICYAYDAKGSKIEIKVNYDGSDISGTIDYALAEKDKNTGTFKGKITNGILLMDYTFQSEGTKNMRQLAFKLVDNQLIEGYGEMNNDGTRFKDVSKLQFNSNMPLSKVNCPKD